jgi:hypothetical protein
MSWSKICDRIFDSVIIVTAFAGEKSMMIPDIGDYFLLISSIFFPQEKFGPESIRPILLESEVVP